MCGHIGLLDPNKHVSEKQGKQFIVSSLFVDTMRGSDNTGMAIGDGANTEVIKSILPGTEWVAHHHNANRAASLLNKGTYFLGHNRAGTVGGFSVANAHPFITKDKTITGAHNGTLDWGWRGLLGNFTTDSEALFNSVEEKGLKWVVEEVPGAMSLVWLDHVNGSLNFYRNEHRPMWILKTKNNILMYGSDPDMVWFAASRAGIATGKARIIELPVNVHRSYDLKSLKAVNIGGFKMAKKPVPKQTNHSGGGHKQTSYVSNGERWVYNKALNAYQVDTSYVPPVKHNKQLEVKNTTLPSVINAKLAKIGTAKRLGSQVLWIPVGKAQMMQTPGKVVLFVKHLWEFDAGLKQDKEFSGKIVGVDKEVAEKIMDLRGVMAFSSRIKGVVNNQVHLEATNLEALDPYESPEFSKCKLELENTPNFSDHFRSGGYSDEGLPFDDPTIQAQKKQDHHRLRWREKGKDLHVWKKLEIDYLLAKNEYTISHEKIVCNACHAKIRNGYFLEKLTGNRLHPGCGSKHYRKSMDWVER